jgi:hypothetical protein
MRMLTQHARIRGLVMELGDEVLRGETRPETLRSLGEQLDAHVRLEERTVCPLIERTHPAHVLQEVSARLEVFEAGPVAEPWVPSEGLSFDPWPGPVTVKVGLRLMLAFVRKEWHEGSSS